MHTNLSTIEAKFAELLSFFFSILELVSQDQSLQLMLFKTYISVCSLVFLAQSSFISLGLHFLLYLNHYLNGPLFIGLQIIGYFTT